MNEQLSLIDLVLHASLTVQAVMALLLCCAGLARASAALVTVNNSSIQQNLIPTEPPGIPGIGAASA